MKANSIYYTSLSRRALTSRHMAADDRKLNPMAADMQPFHVASAPVTAINGSGECTIRGPLNYVVRELRRLQLSRPDATALFAGKTVSAFRIEADGVQPFQVLSDSVELEILPYPSDVFALTCACLLQYSDMPNLRHIDVRTEVAPYLVEAFRMGQFRRHTNELHVLFRVPNRAGLESGYVVRSLLALAISAPNANATHVTIRHEIGAHSAHAFLLEMWVVATRDFFDMSTNPNNSLLHDFGSAAAHELYFSQQCTNADLSGLNWCTISNERITFPRGSKPNGLAMYTDFWSHRQWGTARTLEMRRRVQPTDGRYTCTYQAIVPLRGTVFLRQIEAEAVPSSVRKLVTPMLKHRDLENPLSLEVYGDLTGLSINATDSLNITEMIVVIGRTAPLLAVQLLSANPSIRSLHFMVRDFVPTPDAMKPVANLLNDVAHLSRLRFSVGDPVPNSVQVRREGVRDNLSRLIMDVCTTGALTQLTSLSLQVVQGTHPGIRTFFALDRSNERPLLRNLSLHFDASMTDEDIRSLFSGMEKKPQFRELQSLVVSFVRADQAPGVALLMRYFGTHLRALTSLRVECGRGVFGRAAYLPDAMIESLLTPAELLELAENRQHARTLANAVRDIASQCRLHTIWCPIEFEIGEVLPMLENPNDPGQYATRAPVSSLRLNIHPRVSAREKEQFLGILASLRNSMRDLHLSGDFVHALESDYEFEMKSVAAFGYRDFRAAELTATGAVMAEMNLDEFYGGESVFARHLVQLFADKQATDVAALPVSHAERHHRHRRLGASISTPAAYQALCADKCAFHRLISSYVQMRIRQPLLLARLADVNDRDANQQPELIRRLLDYSLWEASERTDSLTRFRLDTLQTFHVRFASASIAYLFDLLDDDPRTAANQLVVTGACLHAEDLTTLRCLLATCCSDCHACMAPKCLHQNR